MNYSRVAEIFSETRQSWNPNLWNIFFKRVSLTLLNSPTWNPNRGQSWNSDPCNVYFVWNLYVKNGSGIKLRWQKLRRVSYVLLFSFSLSSTNKRRKYQKSHTAFNLLATLSYIETNNHHKLRIIISESEIRKKYQ